MKFSKQCCILIKVLVIMALNLTSPNITLAESEAACRTYANLAVNHYQHAKSLNCPSISGPRWQDNYNNHYGWCLKAPPEALDNENNIRASLISLCQKNSNAVRCDAYAHNAVAQGEEARARNCGMDNSPRWTASYENHLNWCLHNPPNAAENETREREGPLSRCRTTNPVGGGPASKPTISVEAQISMATANTYNVLVGGSGFKAGDNVTVSFRVGSAGSWTSQPTTTADNLGRISQPTFSLICSPGTKYEIKAVGSQSGESNTSGFSC
jgi:hypothetical protein